jgi:hypothetical protein
MRAWHVIDMIGTVHLILSGPGRSSMIRICHRFASVRGQFREDIRRSHVMIRKHGTQKRQYNSRNEKETHVCNNRKLEYQNISKAKRA